MKSSCYTHQVFGKGTYVFYSTARQLPVLVVVLVTVVTCPSPLAHGQIGGGCGFFVQLIITFRRIYGDMNESSRTPS